MHECIDYMFVEGDTASVVEIVCKDVDGNIIDLTGATVRIRWKNTAGTIVEKEMTIVSAALGTAKYQFGVDELYPPRMKFEYTVTDVSSKVLTSQCLDVVAVRSKLS